MDSERQPLLAAGIVNPRPFISPDQQSLPIETPSTNNDDAQGASRPSEAILSFKLIAVMYCWLCSGIIVAAIGALLDDIRLFYQIDDTTASLIFPTAVVGYVLAASSLPLVVARSGLRGVAIITPVCYVTAMLILSFGFPFFVSLIGHFLGGIAYGISDAGFNAWGSKQRRANVVEGYLHAACAVGCIVGPVSTLVVTGNQLPWYYYYRGMVVLSLLQFISLSVAFRKDRSIGDRVDDGDEGVTDTIKQQSSVNIRSRTVKLIVYCCLYYFVYQLIESSFNNYIVSFMKRARDMNQTKSAFSLSIFWIGMTLGRVLLSRVTEYYGTANAVCIYIAISACAQFTFIVVHNETVSFILLAMEGFFVGPLFPSGIVFLGQKLPVREAFIAVSIAIALGMVGCALGPLAIGFMADRSGLEHLPKLICGFLVVLVFLWVAFTRAT